VSNLSYIQKSYFGLKMFFKSKIEGARKMKKQIFLVLVSILILSNFADAALIDNTGGLIYDTDLNITWYDYTKSADTWSNQKDWAAGLAVGGVTGWRLPSTIDGPSVWGINGATTAGYNITTSELGHLYYVELGNKGFADVNGNYPQSGYGLANKGPLTNLSPSDYWSGTAYSSSSGDAWYFLLQYGAQINDLQSSTKLALAVHSGNIGPNGAIYVASAVPVPGALWLFAPALAGLIGLRRKYLG
jgi:hypothetical protein